MFGAAASPPRSMNGDGFRLEPLGPEHNERDHVAWMSSIEHIKATPGFTSESWGGDAWPYAMSLDDNLVDLVKHAEEFEAGENFAYSVLDPQTDDVIGCVYVDRDESGLADAMCRCWVRVSHAHLDGPLHAALAAWFAGSEWPSPTVRFPGRTPQSEPT